jgi:dihydroxy-acid dehydratase
LGFNGVPGGRNFLSGISRGRSCITSGLIADSVELVIRRHAYDGVVGIAGGDKTIPGLVMAMARLNVPSVFVYGGATPPGQLSGGRETAVLDTEALASDAVDAPEHFCCPAVGVCQRQFTASTMALVGQVLGLSPLSSVMSPTGHSERLGLARHAGEIVLRILDEGGPLPRDLITRKSLENACAVVAVTGGSTNAVLQMPAIGHEAGISFSIEDVQTVFRRALLTGELQSGGRQRLSNLYLAEGVPAVLKALLTSGAVRGDALTIDGTELQAAVQL